MAFVQWNFSFLSMCSSEFLECVSSYSKGLTGKEKDWLQPSTESTGPHCRVGTPFTSLHTRPFIDRLEPRDYQARCVSPVIGARTFSDRNETESDNDHPHTPS